MKADPSSEPAGGVDGEGSGHDMVAAADALLDEAGLEGLTIRALLARTGLARRAFYERYAGKDDLVLAVFERTICAAADRFRMLAAPLDQPMDRLRLIVTSIALGTDDPLSGRGGGGRRGAAMSREHLRLAETRPSELQAALRPLVGLIAEHLADGMAQGQVRQTDANRLAALVYNVVSTTVHGELLAEEAGERPTALRSGSADEIWEFCRRAILA